MKCLEPQYMLGLRVMSKKGLDAYGETDYKSLIPCNYKPFPKDNGEGQKEVA